MKKLLIYILLAAAGISVAVAATSSPVEKRITVSRPDMDQIRRDVSDPSSPYYYPKLMERYERNETIMNLEDYRHLYLGYMFQEDYNPYRHSEYTKRIEPLTYKEKHTRAELDTIIEYAGKALADTPFDLTQMNFLIYALREKEKVNLARIWQYRLNHLLEAIISTGTGLDEENAWYVINPRHEYALINFRNDVAEQQKFIEPYYDYIQVKTSAGKPAGYYFNIRNLLEEYYRKHPEQ